MVTSLLAVVHIKDSVCPIPTQVTLAWLKRRQLRGLSWFPYTGAILIRETRSCLNSTCSSLCHKVMIVFKNLRHFHHIPYYSSPGESSDTESAEEEETEDTEGPLSSRWKYLLSALLSWILSFKSKTPRARCVVCQLERVTRAALPCRYPSLLAWFSTKIMAIHQPPCCYLISTFFSPLHNHSPCTLQACHHLRLLLWPTQISVSHVQVTEFMHQLSIYCSEFSCMDSNVLKPLMFSGPLSIHTSYWVQSPNLHLIRHHLLLQQGLSNLCAKYDITYWMAAFGSAFSAGGKISTSGWWGVLAGQICNTAVSLERQKGIE